MSNLFGPPPPPPSRIFEPGANAAVPHHHGTGDGWYEDESPHEGRRLALLAAFVAVVFLLLANLGTWLHFDGFHPNQAQVVADATFEPATRAIAAQLTETFSAAIDPQVTGATADSAALTDSRRKVAEDIDKATRTALASPAVREAWDTAVAETLRKQQLKIDGKAPDQQPIVLVVETTGITNATFAALRTTYNFGAEDVSSGTYAVTVNGASGSTASALGLLQDLWLVFWVLAIAFGAGSILLASRPLRLSVILCIDAVVMLGAFLVAVQIAGQLADDQASTEAQSTLIRSGFEALTQSLESQTVTLMWLAGGTGVVLALIARVRGRRRRARYAA